MAPNATTSEKCTIILRPNPTADTIVAIIDDQSSARLLRVGHSDESSKPAVGLDLPAGARRVPGFSGRPVRLRIPRECVLHHIPTWRGLIFSKPDPLLGKRDWP